jgi:hypothetical protein
MSGAEIYLAKDERGWLAIHESRHGDSSGMEGPFPSIIAAVAAGREMSERYGVPFRGDGMKDKVLPLPTDNDGRDDN